MSITAKIDHVTLIREEQKSEIPPAPISCKIELTSRCNLRCTYCATSANLRPKGDMSREFYADRLLPMLRAAGVQEVGMFFLGESMILHDLDWWIAEARRQGFEYVFLTTSGTTPHFENRIEECMQAGLDSLKFSLNYASAEQFAEIARVSPKMFEKQLEAVRAAYRIREWGQYGTKLYASYIDYDAEQGKRMKAILDTVRPYLDEIYALPLYSQAALTGDASEGKGWHVLAGNPGRVGALREPLPCWALWGEARVTWDGHLSACCFSHDGRFLMADLKEVDFMDGWHSQPFRDLRRAHLAKDVRGTACEKCAAYG